MGPQAMPEEWNRDEKVIFYVIPKTFADWLKPKMGETGIYSFLYVSVVGLMSKEIICFHAEVFGSFRFLDDLVIHQLVCWQGYLHSRCREA